MWNILPLSLAPTLCVYGTMSIRRTRPLTLALAIYFIKHQLINTPSQTSTIHLCYAFLVTMLGSLFSSISTHRSIITVRVETPQI